jgi:hypothetical protein
MHTKHHRNVHHPAAVLLAPCAASDGLPLLLPMSLPLLLALLDLLPLGLALGGGGGCDDLLLPLATVTEASGRTTR